MKRTFLHILIISSINSVSAQFSLDHYHPAALYAKEGIDTCSIYVLQPDSSLEIEQSYIYNEQGLEIENRKDDQGFSFKNIYDDSGRQVAQYFVPFGEKFYERDTLIYNANNQLIKRITYENDGSESYREEYDYEDNRIKEERYILKNELQTKYLYFYDSHNRLQHEELFFKGNHSEDWFYKYDRNDSLSSFANVAVNGDTTVLQKFEYNSLGLRVKHIIYTNRQLSMEYLTSYDDRKLIRYREAYTDIKNNDPLTGDYEKTIYKYTYR